MEKYTTYIVIFLVIGGGFFVFFTCEYFEDFRSELFVSHESQSFSEEQDGLAGIFENRKEREERIAYADVPLREYSKRITKKPFGIYITPETSSVESERFRGYHTGVDFEIFDEEVNERILIKAICDGPVRMRQHVNGYGGVFVQECKIGEERVTVLYGHLDSDSVIHALNADVSYGDIIGVLGEHESAHTDGERKHLHLSIYKGEFIEVRGYVSSEDELVSWIDPCDILLCEK